MSEACELCAVVPGLKHEDHGEIRMDNGMVAVPSRKRPGTVNRVPVDVFAAAVSCEDCMMPRPGGRRPCAKHQPAFDRHYRNGAHRRRGTA